MALEIQNVDYLQYPAGTTAQRPTPVAGMMRFNSTTGLLEYYNGTTWAVMGGATYIATYLVVAAGGGGGTYNPGSYGGGNGGSGVVVISIPTARYSGTTTGSPTVTISGTNKILTFTASGSYTA